MLARLIGPVRTRDLMYTGRTLTAQQALDWFKERRSPSWVHPDLRVDGRL
jgi:hypothetical protein